MLEVIIPKPIITAANVTNVPTTGINAINHNTIDDNINMPKIPIVFCIFNLLQMILLIAVINIELLIPIKMNNDASNKKAIPDVIPNNNNITNATVIAIGVNIPKPITGRVLLTSSLLEFSNNLGASHKHNNHIITTEETKVHKESR